MKGSSGGRWRDRKSQRPPLDDGCHLEVWFWWGKALAENGMSGGGGRVWGVVRDRGRLDSTPNMVYSDLERMPNLRAAGIRYFLPALLCRGDLTVMVHFSGWEEHACCWPGHAHLPLPKCMCCLLAWNKLVPEPQPIEGRYGYEGKR